MTSFPHLSEIHTSRIVATNFPPQIPYSNLTTLSISIAGSESLEGLEALLPFCPTLVDLRITTGDTSSRSFSLPSFTSLLLGLSDRLKTLHLKSHHGSQIGSFISSPPFDSILPNMTSLQRLELGSHGFSSFDFLHHLPNLRHLEVVNVTDELPALVPWSWDDLVDVLAGLDEGRPLRVTVLMRGNSYEERMVVATGKLQRAQQGKANVEVWAGRERDASVLRIYPWDSE
ncbi:hypothetical protein T439DRAFT_174197 [Meredithblackwellia eburnea MCA 4105]